MKASNKEAILSVKGVVNRFGKQVIHEGLDLEIEKGIILGIVGGSGSGKTVLLRTMTGLHKPNAGEVTIAGRPVNEIKPKETSSLFGVMFQQGALFSAQNVAGNIILPLKEHTQLSPAECEMLAYMKIAMVGLGPEAGKKLPSELSGGMTKRASLARALAMDPLILFLDEPTAGLDPVAASAFDELILKLNRSLGVTVVMITHDVDTLFTVCDKVAVLVDKKIIVDTLPNLLKSEHKWIREYFHGPRARGAAMAAKETAKDNKQESHNGKQ